MVWIPNQVRNDRPVGKSSLPRWERVRMRDNFPPSPRIKYGAGSCPLPSRERNLGIFVAMTFWIGSVRQLQRLCASLLSAGIFVTITLEECYGLFDTSGFSMTVGGSFKSLQTNKEIPLGCSRLPAKLFYDHTAIAFPLTVNTAAVLLTVEIESPGYMPAVGVALSQVGI